MKLPKLPSTLRRGQWSVHVCPLDKTCRQHGAPPRVQFVTPLGSLHVAVWRGGSTQLWLPWKTAGLFGEKSNYSRWWSPIAWHPARRSQREERDK